MGVHMGEHRVYTGWTLWIHFELYYFFRLFYSICLYLTFGIFKNSKISNLSIHRIQCSTTNSKSTMEEKSLLSNENMIDHGFTADNKIDQLRSLYNQHNYMSNNKRWILPLQSHGLNNKTTTTTTTMHFVTCFAKTTNVAYCTRWVY